MAGIDLSKFQVRKPRIDLSDSEEDVSDVLEECDFEDGEEITE